MYWKHGAALRVSLVATPAFALLGLDSTPPENLAYAVEHLNDETH